MSLRDYGWTAFFRESFESLNDPALEPGRVIVPGGSACRVTTERGEVQAAMAGRLRHGTVSAAELPAVGDWVALRGPGDGTARIEHVLPRLTRISRRASGRPDDEQIVAANVDSVFVVMGLDGNLNLRRLERFVAVARESGARAVVLLNKLDLCADAAGHRLAVEACAGDAPVVLVSCADGRGLEAVRARLRPCETAVLVGSSGVGKSTLINRLLGRPALPTRAVRQGDDRGRHTTSHRELFLLPSGGMLIDNPGVRELQPWGDEETVERVFDDVTAFAARCRFGDCTHETEPGCAVREAVEAGTLDPARLASYRRLLKEARHLALRRDGAARREQRRKWRAIHRSMRRSGHHRR